MDKRVAGRSPCAPLKGGKSAGAVRRRPYSAHPERGVRQWRALTVRRRIIFATRSRDNGQSDFIPC